MSHARPLLPGALALLTIAGSGCMVGEIDDDGPEQRESIELHVELRGEASTSMVLSGPADDAEHMVETLIATVRADGPVDGGDTIVIRGAGLDADAESGAAAAQLGAPLLEGIDGDTIAALAAGDGFTVVSSGVTTQELVLTLLTPARFALCPDYRGDRRCDAAIFRPSTAEWWIRNDPYPVARWGKSGDKPVTGDYDGDGRTDRAVFRPSTGQWRIDGSAGSPLYYFLGGSVDALVPGDYDGDGRTDPAVYLRELRQFWVLRSRDGLQSRFQMPSAGDPIAADVDGDGASDPCVVDRITIWWYCLPSRTGGVAARWLGVPPTTPYGLQVPFAAPTTSGQNLRVWSAGTMSLIDGFMSGYSVNTVALPWQTGEFPVVAEDGNDSASDLLLWNPNSGRWHGVEYKLGTGQRPISFFWGGYGDIAVGARGLDPR